MQDPWASTVSTAVQQQLQEAAEPPPLGVGEGWADSIISKDDTTLLDQAEDIEQHKRAEAAVPPVGIDPAGPLDVHTPAAEALSSHQPTFDLPSTLEEVAPAERMIGPPGLSRRGGSRMQQDAPVIISGTNGSSDVDRIGVQFGSLNLFGNSDADHSLVPSLVPQNNHQAASQQSLYETPTSLEQQKSQEPSQAAPLQSHTDQIPFNSYQFASIQQGYGQDRGSGLQGYGGQDSQQQQPLPSQASAYTNRYPQMHNLYNQQGQQQSQLDPFAALPNNAPAAGSPYTQQPGPGIRDAISPYFTSQQSQHGQGSSAQTGQHVTPSPALPSTRATGTAVPQAAPGQAPAYAEFTSAIGQISQQQPQQHGYPNDYASLYGLQDPMRNLVCKGPGRARQQANISH